jgi:predicted RNA-binding Zn-ribbon protein involved in translation (DUF1610 family)
VHGGDCLDVLKGLPENSIDSCVTDPPYALTNRTPDVKWCVDCNRVLGGREGKPVVCPKCGGALEYQRSSGGRGFMGKQWDTGERAFTVELWAEVLRVLKPGAHVLAFGGTRTVHRLACAIEDAGFEIRDQIMWVFGSGFLKSHDVSKGIDKLDANDKRRERNLRFTAWMRSTNLTRGKATSILRASGAITENGTMAGHFFAASDEGQPAVATRELFDVMRPHFGAPVPKWVEALVDERTVESENFKRREVVGSKLAGIANPNDIGRHTIGGSKAVEVDITAPATSAAREWQGWGTALKPAVEPVVLARKPLSEGTVAANVLKHGTGAINVDGCRVAHDEACRMMAPSQANIDSPSDKHRQAGRRTAVLELKPSGRWPANLIHDGSDEVVRAFPETKSGQLSPHHDAKPSSNGSMSGGNYAGRIKSNFGGDTGSAARFFYSARPDHRCALCDAFIAEASSPTGNIQTESSVRPDAPVSRSRGNGGNENPSNGYASNVASPFELCLQPICGSAPESAPPWPLERIAQNVKSAASLCDSCGTAIALALAEARQRRSLGSLQFPGSISEHNAQILRRHLALYVAGREDTDTILTTASLKMLLGSVFHAIANTTDQNEAKPHPFA